MLIFFTIVSTTNGVPKPIQTFDSQVGVEELDVECEEYAWSSRTNLQSFIDTRSLQISGLLCQFQLLLSTNFKTITPRHKMIYFFFTFLMNKFTQTPQIVSQHGHIPKLLKKSTNAHY